MTASLQNDSLLGGLRLQAREAAAKPALLAPGQTPLGYADLLAEIEAGVRQLVAFGLRPKDVVAVSLPSGPKATVVMCCLLSATCCAPLNPAAHLHEISRVLTQVRATAIVLRRGEDSAARKAAQELGLRIIEIEVLPDRRAGQVNWQAETIPAPAVNGARGPEDPVLLLQTSGTTADPKIVPLTEANLLAAVRNMARSLELGPEDRTLNVMPLFHMHGLTTALVTLLTGGQVVCVPGFAGDTFFEWLEEFSPTWFTAAPAIHRAVLAHARARGIADGRFPMRVLRTGSAPLALEESQALERLFGAVMIEVWGMTEASCSTTNRTHWRKPGSVGQALGTEVAVLDEAGVPLPSGQRGEVWVRGPNVIRRYHSPPEANHDAFREAWLRTGDLGYLDGDGFLFIRGRIKEQINRGGEKIAPSDIDELVLGHPAVAEAVAFGLPHARLGETVATAVVLKPGCLANAQDIQEHIAREAAQYKVPHHVFFVPALPKTATGKPQRLLLSKRFAGETASRGEAPALDLASASLLQQELHAIWAEVLGFKGFSLRDNFFYQGGDSLGVIRVLAEIRRRLGRELDPAVFLRSPTVQQLAAEIAVAAVGAGEPEVVALQAAGSRRPFHMLGGSLPFLDFVHRFHPPADQPFFLIPPLTLGYLPPRPAVAAIARQHLATLRAHQPHGPYCLIGYCFHGVVVHEMACELVAQGESVPRLVLVDTTPSCPDLRQKVVALLDFLRRRGYTGAPDEGPVMAAWLNRATRFQTWSRSGWDFKRQTLAGLLSRRLRWRLRRSPLAPTATPTPTPPVTSADEIYGGLMLNRYMLALAGHTMRQFPGPVELFLSEEYRRQTALPPDRGWERWAASVRLHALRGGHDDCLLTDAAGFGRRLAELGVTPETGLRVNRPGKDGHRTGHAGEQRRKVVAT